jgi:hypothetical protein
VDDCYLSSLIMLSLQNVVATRRVLVDVLDLSRRVGDKIIADIIVVKGSNDLLRKRMLVE